MLGGKVRTLEGLTNIQFVGRALFRVRIKVIKKIIIIFLSSEI
jgi:hypothetical protein